MRIWLAVLSMIILVVAILTIKMTIWESTKEEKQPQETPRQPAQPTLPRAAPPSTPSPDVEQFFPLGTNTKLGKQVLWMHPNKYDDSWVNDASQWDTVADALDVFGFFFIQVDKANGDAFEKKLLKQKGIRISIEVGGLRPFQCDGTTFFNQIDKPVFDKLVNGGHKNFIVSLDAPFTYTVQDGFHSQCAQLFASGDNAKFSASGCDPKTTMQCSYTVSQVADELIEYLALFAKNYPHAEIGWIEPLPLLRFSSYPSEKPPIDGKSFPDFKQIVDVLMQKIAAYNAANDPDIKLSFFHSDSYFTGMMVPIIQNTYDSWAKHIAASNYLRTKGLRFGILLNDYRKTLPTQAEKDKAFSEGVLNYYDCWHAKGGTLDDVVVESWVGDHPSLGVPEEKTYTFTNLMTKLIQRMLDQNYAPKCDAQKIIQDILDMPAESPKNSRNQ